MTIKKEGNGSSLTVYIEGKLDALTSPELEKELGDLQGIENLVLDLKDLLYTSSAGLRVLLMMYKSLENKDRFELKGVNDAVREILETTGFDQFLLKDNFD